MKTWVVVTGNGIDEYIAPCKSMEEAIAEAEIAWERLTTNEKKKHYVMAGLVNIDKEGNYLEVNGQIDADIYEIVYQNGENKKEELKMTLMGKIEKAVEKEAMKRGTMGTEEIAVTLQVTDAEKEIFLSDLADKLAAKYSYELNGNELAIFWSEE